MQLKKGVIMTGLRLVMRPVLIEADKIYRDYGEELVVTSALDGTHSPGSMHYYGYALDFRTRDFDELTLLKVIVDLQKALRKYGFHYKVIRHKDHLHIEHPVGFKQKD
jgi:hypothetical protein